jgi:hypothetical protein
MISCPNDYQTPDTENQNVQRTLANQNVIQAPPDKKCYNCEKKGHFTITCPNSCSHPPLTLAANSTPPLNHNGDSNPVKAKQNYACGRVNQVAMEEAQNAPTVVTGTFLVNLNPVPGALFFSTLRISG